MRYSIGQPQARTLAAVIAIMVSKLTPNEERPTKVEMMAQQEHAEAPGASSDDLKSPGIASRTPQRVVVLRHASRTPLTKCEREVLKLIGDGHSSKQGAMQMNVSPKTFESHRAEAMRKLGERNTAELVRAALSSFEEV
jgi:DNA-binding CsgD family transcriptional regulator